MIGGLDDDVVGKEVGTEEEADGLDEVGLLRLATLEN